MERTLGHEFYFSEEIFAEEKERILCREWLCAGREEALPAAGDYLVVEVAGESILVVRTGVGDARGPLQRVPAPWVTPGADDSQGSLGAPSVAPIIPGRTPWTAPAGPLRTWMKVKRITADRCIPSWVPAFGQRGGSDLDWERGIPHREGAWTFTETGTTNRRPFDGSTRTSGFGIREN